MSADPVVVYRCVVAGCGKQIAALFAVRGEPRLAHRYDASGYSSKPSHAVLPGPTSPWWIHDALQLDEALKLGIGCRQHGRWDASIDEVLRDWDTARAGGSGQVKLDRSRITPRT